MKIYILIILVYSTFNLSFGQASLSINFPFIWNKVNVENNFGPQRSIKGSSIGYGININYSPNFLRNQRFSILIGGGYFIQKFNLYRPFRFDSPVQPIYYTKSYSYSNINGIIGAHFTIFKLNNNTISGSIVHNWLYTFRQSYTPAVRHSSSDPYKQIENDKYNFGNILNLSIGIEKQISTKYSYSFDILAPIYTRWRMDKIFDDDPTEYLNPKFSLGANISVKYKFLN
jgi:hypothetical protein